MSEIFNDIQNIDKNELISQKTIEKLFSIDEPQRTIICDVLCKRAKELKVLTIFKDLIKAQYQSIKRDNDNQNQYVTLNPLFEELGLELTDKGKAKKTINNFVLILRADSFFKTLKLNELTQNMELCKETFSDTTDSLVRDYIENKYGIYDKSKLDDAIRIVAAERKYHPIKDIIENVKWDGTKRIHDFLHFAMLCEDNEYTREVSRLIFAGGINRLYKPGCKFEDVPVLVGINQGEGKSTIIKWLAIEDDYFTEISTVKGQRGMEILEGAWICEMPELTAIKEVDEGMAKDYLSRQVDKFRKAYDKRPGNYKRQCIFIGTTNHEQFLTDKTGNRRFYPIKVNQKAYTLYANEKEYRENIMQCWAEALELYKKGELAPYADKSIINIIKQHQNSSLEEDYRVGMIEDYLKDKTEVCVLQLFQEGLDMGSWAKPTRKDSNEIVIIMQGFKEWKHQGNKTHRFGVYGIQKYWKKETEIPY